MANNFSYGAKGEALTESSEGLRLTSYPDVAGNWTIGIGHKGPDVHPGQTITLDQARSFLAADMQTAVRTVNRCVTFPLTQGEFDALVDLCFNIGVGAFARSTLVRYLNQGKAALAEAQFPLWDHAGGKVVDALLRRREAEEALFESDVTS